MKGVIVGFRRGLGRAYQNTVLVRLTAPDDVDIDKLIGTKVIARDSHGNIYVGKVTRKHGDNRVVRVRFQPNIPGQLLGSAVEIETESLHMG